MDRDRLTITGHIEWRLEEAGTLIACAATYPSSALSGATRQIAYRCTWAAGKATSAVPITEVVLVNETLADTTTEATATVARALLEGANAIPSKTAGSTLTLTWTHSVTGA
jgi:hypothetical protein